MSTDFNEATYQRWIKEGKEKFDQKRYVEALKCFEVALKYKPGDKYALEMFDDCQIRIEKKIGISYDMISYYEEKNCKDIMKECEQLLKNPNIYLSKFTDYTTQETIQPPNVLLRIVGFFSFLFFLIAVVITALSITGKLMVDWNRAVPFMALTFIIGLLCFLIDATKWNRIKIGYSGVTIISDDKERQIPYKKIIEMSPQIKVISIAEGEKIYGINIKEKYRPSIFIRTSPWEALYIYYLYLLLNKENMDKQIKSVNCEERRLYLDAKRLSILSYILPVIITSISILLFMMIGIVWWAGLMIGIILTFGLFSVIGWLLIHGLFFNIDTQIEDIYNRYDAINQILRIKGKTSLKCNISRNYIEKYLASVFVVVGICFIGFGIIIIIISYLTITSGQTMNVVMIMGWLFTPILFLLGIRIILAFRGESNSPHRKHIAIK